MVQSCWILIKLIKIGSNLSRLDQIPQNWFKSIKIAQNCQIWTNFVSIVSFASSLSKFGKILIIFAINSNKVKTITLHAPMETERLFSLVLTWNFWLKFFLGNNFVKKIGFMHFWNQVLSKKLNKMAKKWNLKLCWSLVKTLFFCSKHGKLMF